MIRLQSVDFRGLSGVSFSVPDGGFRWITGPAGSGKSALVSLLAARCRPDAGRVRLFGVDVARLRRAGRARLRRRMGVIDERRLLLADLTVLENTVLPLRINGMQAAAARIEALEVLDWVGLGRIRDRPAGQLSAGERLLCTIARAVVGRPELLVADEPTEGLGVQGDRLFELIAELNRLGATVIVASRNEALRRAHPAPTLTLEGGGLREDAA